MPFRLQAINQWTTIAAGASGAGEGEALRPSAVWLVRLAEMLRSPAAPIRARAGEILVDVAQIGHHRDADVLEANLAQLEHQRRGDMRLFRRIH